MLRAKTPFMLLLLAVLMVAGPALAEDDGEHRVKIRRVVQCEDGEDCADDENVFVMAGDGAEVHVRKVVDCEEGEDCMAAHAGAHVVFVGEDGEIQELDGSDFEWVGDGARAMAVALARGVGGSYLGVQLNELTPELREHFGVGSDSGVMISKVVAGSPAERAGLVVGDIVTAVDGEAVASSGALAKAISSRGEGETVALEVWRDGALQNVVATVAAREAGEGGNMWIPRSGGMHGSHQRHVVIECQDGDCGHAGAFEVDCDGAEECEVLVECDGPDSCECTINGETSSCDEIPGFQALHGHGG